MAIAIVDAAVAVSTASGGDTSITQSFTVTAGVSVLVVLQTARLATALATGVTWNGGAMTAKGDNAFGDMWCQCHVLVNPTSGTHNVVASWDAARRGQICIFTLSGVDTTTPTRTSAGASSLSTGNATTVAGDFCAAVAGQRSQAVTDPASFTNLGSSSVDSLQYGDFAYIVAAGTTQAAAFGGSNGDFAGSLIVPFIPASGGGSAIFGAYYQQYYKSLVTT